MLIKSIRFKNTLWYIIIFTLLLSLLGFLLYINLEKKLYSDIDGFLHATALNIADSIDTVWEKEKLTTLIPDGADNEDKFFNETINIYFFKIIKSWITKNNQEDPRLLNILVQIYDNKANIIISSKDIRTIQILSQTCIYNVLNQDSFYENISIEVSPGKQSVLRFLTVPIIENNKILYIVRVAISLRTMFFALTNLKLILFILLPLTVLLTGIIGILFMNAILNPINKIVNTIHQITAANLKMRINIPDSRDEVYKLAETFNNMLDRLDKSFSSQRKLIEDLSHEIKTPLAVLKGQHEVALKKNRTGKEYKDLLISNLEEINRIIILAENLLTISLFDSKAISLELQMININQILKGILNDLKLLISNKNLQTNLIELNKLNITGDINQIKSLFLNILDNSIKYSKEKSIINITLKKEDKYNIIEVSDSGIGIQENELPFIFDRYYRAIKFSQEKGFGIGLSIVKSIIEMHNGKIEVKSKLNKGTTFIISLP